MKHTRSNLEYYGNLTYNSNCAILKCSVLECEKKMLFFILHISQQLVTTFEAILLLVDRAPVLSRLAHTQDGAAEKSVLALPFKTQYTVPFQNNNIVWCSFHALSRVTQTKLSEIFCCLPSFCKGKIIDSWFEHK